MSEHVIHELAGLVLGELDAETAAGVERHLASCQECRDELAPVLAGAAALRDAADLIQPGLQLPPLRLEPGARPAAAARRQRFARRLWLPAAAAAAAALLLLAGVQLGSLFRPGAPSAPRAPAGATVRLISLTGSPARGQALMIGTGDQQQMQIEVSELPPPPSGSFYEVWLIGGDRALPVGVLPPAGGRYPLPASLDAGYQAIDVSVQQTGSSPAHSGDSILRGSLVH